MLYTLLLNYNIIIYVIILRDLSIMVIQMTFNHKEIGSIPIGPNI